MASSFPFLLLLLFLFHYSGSTGAQTVNMTSKFVANDATNEDEFGYFTATSNNLVVVGAFSESTRNGSAYVYDCTSLPCVKKDKLKATGRIPSDAFGRSVAISGTLVGVGAFEDNINSNLKQGSAYIFDCSSFPCTQKAKLTANGGATDDNFGFSIGISGTMVVVGAFNNAAYVFDCSSFPCVQRDKLTVVNGTYFGSSIAILNRRVVVGDFSYQSRGAVFVYDCSSFPCSRRAMLTASDGGEGDRFGWAVSITEQLVVVGAPYDQVGSNNDQGSAYLYDCSSFPCSQRTKLTTSEEWTNANFGLSVSISGDLVVVGAFGFQSIGAAFIFNCSSFSCPLRSKLLPSDGMPGDDFGSDVAISGNLVVVTSLFDQFESNSELGSAYALRLNGVCHPSCLNCDGPSATDCDQSASIHHGPAALLIFFGSFLLFLFNRSF